MRGGAQVKEALRFVTLLWNHPVLTGLLLLIFTPPFFPLVVYFSPLLMSTALCVVALVSVGSQMEKIKAEGGPGQQLETHLGRDRGVSTWAPPRDRTRNDQGTHLYGEINNRQRNLYANIHVLPAPPSWARAQENNTAAEVQLRPVENNDPPTPATAESDEDWWDKWVKEYESRPGWGEQEDQQAFRTPAAIPTSTTSQARAPATIPAFTQKEEAPLKPEIREENRREASIAAPAPAPVMTVPVSVSVVTNRQEAPSRSAPSPPTTSTSRNLEEVVVSVKVTDFQPHISTLAPIRTGRETTRDRQQQVDRIGKTPQQILGVPSAKVDVVPAARVSDAQALQSIEKLLHMDSRNATPVADVKNVTTTPSLAKSASGKGIAVDASEKNRNKIAADINAGETPPLLRHLKTSRSENHSRNSSAFSPLQQRASRGLMSEKVLPPPQFSPRLLQSLQTLPPKGLSPRLLPNLSTVPLGNPVEKIPQWVYDGIPKERAEMQAMKAETAEEKQVRNFEQAVKVLSYTRRRTHARRPAPIPVETANLQASQSTPTTPSLEKPTEKPSRSSRASSPHKPASSASSPRRASPEVAASEVLPTRNLHDLVAAGEPYGTSERASSLPMPTPRASAAPSPRLPPSNPNGASVAAAAASPSLVMAATPPRSSRASSPKKVPIAASPRRASRASSPSIGSTPWPGSVASPSPQKPSASPSPQTPSAFPSPQKPSASPSPQKPLASPSPQKPSASPPRRPSVPSSPSMPHPRRRRQHSSKHSTDKAPLPSSIQLELSTYYDTPAVEKEDSDTEDYVPIEEVRVVEDKANEAADKGDAALHWGRSSYSSRRSSNSRRRLEPRRVVTSEDADMFCLKKSMSMRNGQTVKFADSSSTTDDERESVTPTASRRSMGRTIKPLVWRSRSVQAHEDSD